MNYAYARVSSKDQNLDRQINEFKAYGITTKNIYSDKESGKTLIEQTIKGLEKN